MTAELPRRPSVLIVDDAVSNLQLLSAVIEEAGYEARAISNARRALQAAMNDPPDLFLLDVRMPEIDGYELCASIKQNSRLCDIPVIFITARTELSGKMQGFSVGCVDYLTRPFHADEVRARVDTHLRIRAMQVEAEKHNRQLVDNYAKLQDLERQRETLMHMVIHDLRSPLGAMICLLGQIQSDLHGWAPTRIEEMVSLASAGAQNMVSIVNSVLDVCRFEGEGMRTNPSDCDLVAIMREAAEGLRPMVGARGFSWRLEHEELKMTVDRSLILRVMQNLIGNAIKFSPEKGEICLGLETGADSARVWVRDTGPGIPIEHRDRIFEKFGRVEQGDRSPVQASTGLGLAFCKMVVNAHGGRIGIDDENRTGSTFWFILPRKA